MLLRVDDLIPLHRSAYYFLAFSEFTYHLPDVIRLSLWQRMFRYTSQNMGWSLVSVISNLVERFDLSFLFSFLSEDGVNIYLDI